MSNQIFLYLAGFFTFVWGLAHLFPTKAVVENFGDISEDNRHIITMEWITEGVALMFIGTLVAAVTFVGYDHMIAKTVYRLAAGVLMVLAGVSLFTGFKVNFLPYKLCPVIFSVSAILLWLGTYL